MAKGSLKKALYGKEVIIGVSGGIAAYKTPFLVRALKQLGANVTCVLTSSGAKFVTPLTMRTLTGQRVYEDMFDESVWDIEHISLSEKADIIVVAPATADALSRMAYGRAEDLLSAVVLAAKSPVLVCPSMNERMWRHPATRENVQRLEKFGYKIVQPVRGELACGDIGEGRLADTDAIIKEIIDIVKK